MSIEDGVSLGQPAETAQGIEIPRYRMLPHLGGLPTREMVKPGAEVYGLEDLARGFADATGVFDVTSLASLVAAEEPISDSDLRALDEEFKVLARNSTGIRSVGDGLFAISPDIAVGPSPEMNDSRNGQGIGRIKPKKVGPPRLHLPEDTEVIRATRYRTRRRARFRAP
jgi:hypothetical protein